MRTPPRADAAPDTPAPAGPTPRAAVATPDTVPHAATAPTLGLWLGLLAVALFGLTLPMTRLAVGAGGVAQLSPWFVTFGRATLAATLSIAFLLATRSSWPPRRCWRDLAIAAAGNGIGYPLGLAFALQTVDASHAAVVTALLPLTTAMAAVVMLRQRAAFGFWVCAAAGTLLVVAFSVQRAAASGRSWVPGAADGWLVAAVLAAAIGYVAGARLTPVLGAERVICWVTVSMLPASLPAALATWPEAPVAASAWAGFVYVGAVSMWSAFFAWYRALSIGGAVAVSQVQVLQPFFAIAAAVPLLGETVDAMTIGYAAAVVATVVAGRWFGGAGRRR